MRFKDEKINYANYLKDRPQETDRAKLSAMKAALVEALKAKDVHGHVSAVYYADGNVMVSINNEYYGVFNSNKGEFFSGAPGD